MTVVVCGKQSRAEFSHTVLSMLWLGPVRLQLQAHTCTHVVIINAQLLIVILEVLGEIGNTNIEGTNVVIMSNTRDYPQEY